ncbi:hypothetical protein MMC18_007330 [Xylographa bjoerkii]|nr:hypothetical protein [Xylographa bjoerkii]
MADSSSKDVKAELLYISPSQLYTKEKPYYIASPPAPGIQQSNETFESKETKITNTRGSESFYSLEDYGFEWIKYPSDASLETNYDLQTYIKDMEEVLKRHLRAEKVYAYDYVVRFNKQQVYRPLE